MSKQLDTSSLITPVTVSTSSSTYSLNLKTFNPGKAAIFPVSSTLIYGEHDAILVDAQFQKQYAREIVTMVRNSGKNLKYVFISHSDPDYYFGLDEIMKAFPQAQIISTAQTAYLISATKDSKMDVWKEKLGPDAPEKLYVPNAITHDQLTIDGQDIDIRQDKKDTAHSYLWIPSLKIILGGISLSTGGHFWMADTLTIKDIDLWISRIEEMQSLKPEKLIPGHYIKNELSPSALDYVKKYLTDYRAAVVTHKDSGGIISYMKEKYPDLPNRESLEFGAQVFTGETPWSVMSPYPPIGQIAEVNFEGTIFNLDVRDNLTMSFEGISGAFKGEKDTVEYTAVEVGKNIFMVYWHEPHAGSNVVHLQDWNGGTVYTNISTKDNLFIHLKGTIRIK